MVDWSAQATPKRGADSIWACTFHTRTARYDEPVNHRTRQAASDALIELARRPGRTLIGFDFPLGHPVGFAAAAGLVSEFDDEAPWSSVWRHLATHLKDDDRNRNNRWEVAAALNERLGTLHFWGAPPSKAGEFLTSRRPPATPDQLSVYRSSERRLREQQRYPFSVWQLLGAGSVGSQALTGIPVAHRLRTHPDLAERTLVWPFETGLTADPVGDRADLIVLSEVWPSAIRFDHVTHPIKDAQQVIALAEHFAALDQSQGLGAYFAPALDEAERTTVCREEGWVLGVV